MPRDMTLSMPLDEHINADTLNAAGHQSSCKTDKDIENHDLPSWTALHNSADTSDAESDVDQLTDTNGLFSHPPQHKHTFFHNRPIGMKHTYERNPFSGSKTGKLVQMELKNLNTRGAPFSMPSLAASGGSQTSGSIRQITGAHSTPPTSSTSARSAFGAKKQVKSVGSVAALRSRFLGVVITTPALRGQRSTKSSMVSSSEATDIPPPSSSVAIFPDQPRPNTCVDRRRSLGSSITPVPLGAPVIDWQHPLTALQRDCAHVHEFSPFSSLPPSLEPTSSLSISSSTGIRLYPSRLQLWRSEDKSFTGTPRRTPFDSNNRDRDASHTNPASLIEREPEAERSTGFEDSPFKAFKFALDQDTLPERHASVPRERASVALALGSSLSTSSVARTSARKAGPFEQPAIAQRRSYPRQAKAAPQDIPKVLREDEFEEFFGAELGRAYFGKEGAGAVVDAEVVKMNLRHLFASMSGRKDEIGDQDEDRRIDAVSTRSFGKPSYSRGERFIEALEESFGAGSEDRGQGRKPNKVQMRKGRTPESNSASKTSREASVSSDDDIHRLSLGLKRPLYGEPELTSHKRARANKLEANSESNSVNEAMAEEWVATMQRLIKGKVMPDKKSLRGLSDLLRMVNDLRSHVGTDVLKATRLNDTVMQLSQLEDVPFGDEHGLRGRARELGKFWEIVLRKP